MNAVEMAEAIKGIQAAGSLEHYILYAVVVFCLGVVTYLVRDHVKNHDKLIEAFQNNTTVIKQNQETKEALRAEIVDMKKGLVERGGCKFLPAPR